MNIRNFSIIAHIDHGKSTLADRIIELCGGLSEREMTSQVLDTLELEQERGITIKSQTVNLTYKADDGEVYQFNLIDTPGHVDFAYEVSRSLSACEGAILLVDASQGVEAQTLSTCYNAVEEGLTIIPVLNKIDLAQSDPEKVKKEIEEIIGVDASNAPAISAKNGTGIKEVLEQVVSMVPAPSIETEEPLQASIIDSWFDNYLGVVSLVRVVKGKISKGDKRVFLMNGKIKGAISRLPKKGSILSNMSKGASAKKIEISQHEMKISKIVATKLKKQNIYFAGIDFIQGKLIGDINVTSPTGLKTYYDLTGVNLAKYFFDNI